MGVVDWIHIIVIIDLILLVPTICYELGYQEASHKYCQMINAAYIESIKDA